MGKEKRICHYVPKCYQMFWAHDKKVFYFEKENRKLLKKNGNTTGEYNVEKQMFIRDYYKTDLEIINFLEDHFNCEFENKWIKQVENIVNKISKNENLIIKDLQELLSFMSIQYFRIYDNCKPHILKSNQKGTQTEEQNISDWKGALIDIFNPSEDAYELRDYFNKFYPYIFTSKNNFILSSNPIVILHQDDPKIERAYFPITPNICIMCDMLTNPSDESCKVSVQEIDQSDFKYVNNGLLENGFDFYGCISNKSDV